ncbi:MAG: UpxY family transcription antiterminator [Rikenellaceae bacterium]
MIQIEYNIKGAVWYAMKASYGKALKAKEDLDSLLIENYLPMRYEKEKENGRCKLVAVPAIKNLIFIKADMERLNESKREIDCLHNMLIKKDDNGELLVPIVVSECDMIRFMTVVEDMQEKVRYVEIAKNRQILAKGTPVRITDGKYKGYEGVLMRPKGSRAKKVVIDINGLTYVEMPFIDVELIEKI